MEDDDEEEDYIEPSSKTLKSKAARKAQKTITTKQQGR
jgi:hypothetical protein